MPAHVVLESFRVYGVGRRALDISKTCSTANFLAAYYKEEVNEEVRTQ